MDNSEIKKLTKFEFKTTAKEWKNQLKEIKEKSGWNEFIKKHDDDYDYASLLGVLEHKLRRMRMYMEISDILEKKEINKIVKQIKQVED